MQSQDTLIQELTDLVVKSLNLHFVDKKTISENTEFMGAGLGLDSEDILEVVVAVEQKYKVKIKSANEGKTIFRNFGTLAKFIRESSTLPPPINDANVQAQPL